MPKITLFTGALLCLIGLSAFFSTGASHPTALIPLFFGLPLAVCGKLSEKPERRKIVMHVAVTLALLGFIGAGMRIPKLAGEEASVKVMSIWSMALLCFMLTGLYVRSFINARKG